MGDLNPPIHLIREKSGFLDLLAPHGLTSLESLSSPSLGQFVTESRSSWVRKLDLSPIRLFIKTYNYPTRRDRIRGWFRTTLAAPSRALKEWNALTWLRSQGLGGPEPLALLEHRELGVLHRATLITESFPGEGLDLLLPKLAPDARDTLLRELEDHVTRLHLAGFRDRNLDLRNLLARTSSEGAWEIVKIDSPRHRILEPGATTDRLAREDWDRLARSLDEAGL